MQRVEKGFTVFLHLIKSGLEYTGIFPERLIASPTDFNTFATKVRNGELSESWNAYIVGASGGGVDEQDVLVVRDEKTGEISVVAGLSRDGTPKRAPAKAENTSDFLRFDRNSDLMDSFFRNFFRQCKKPSRFGFYRIAADQVENLLGVMKELLKDPEVQSTAYTISEISAFYLFLCSESLQWQEFITI